MKGNSRLEVKIFIRDIQNLFKEIQGWMVLTFKANIDIKRKFD